MSARAWKVSTLVAGVAALLLGGAAVRLSAYNDAREDKERQRVWDDAQKQLAADSIRDAFADRYAELWGRRDAMVANVLLMPRSLIDERGREWQYVGLVRYSLGTNTDTGSIGVMARVDGNSTVWALSPPLRQ